MKHWFFLSILYFHGANATLLDFLLGFVQDPIDHQNVVAAVSECLLKEGEKTCKFPTLDLSQDVFTLDVHNDEMGLSTVPGETSSPVSTIDCVKVNLGVEGAQHYECEGLGHEANFIQMAGDDGVERIYGSIHIGDDVCRITPNLGDDTTQITCTPGSSFGDEEELIDDEDDEEAQSRRQLRIQAKFGHIRLGMADHALRERRLNDDLFIDLMVVWTKKAECLESRLAADCVPTLQTETRMRALISLAMQETNTAFFLSGIQTHLRLVHAYRHEEYEEPTSKVFNTIMSHVRNVDDGELEDVHANRILYSADAVHVIAAGTGACGVGHVGPSITRMFSISRFSCATGYYSFGHEIAHNLGAHHDRGTLNRCDQNGSYNYGYKDPNAEFRSIMAYGCRVNRCDNMPKNGCIRVQRFSNTVSDYQGKKIGDEFNNNAKVINEKFRIAANYYPSMNCKVDSDCDDRNPSTVDTCEALGVCKFTPGIPTTNPLPSAFMESILVRGVSSTRSTTVMMNKTYLSPVIVCTVKYGNARDLVPAVVRMRNVQSNTFSIELQSPSNSQLVGSRDVHCLAVEEGGWKLPDGRKIEAQSYLSTVTDSKVSWVGEPRAFQQNYQSPVVVGQVMTSNDDNWSVFWARGRSSKSDVDANNMWTGKHVGEDPQRTRSPEMIGYIVFESGHATVEGLELEATRGGPTIFGYTQSSYAYAFQSPFSTPPRVIVAAPLRMMGADGCWPVLTSDPTERSFGLSVDEDHIFDHERGQFNPIDFLER